MSVTLKIQPIRPMYVLLTLKVPLQFQLDITKYVSLKKVKT